MRFCPALAIALLVPLSAMAETFTGYVSDSRCGMKRAALTPADLKDMQDCIKAGAVPVLVVGDNVMPIVYTSVAKVLPFLGQKVTVAGTLESGGRGPKLLVVEKIEKAK
jgi:hypothetical protein